MQVNSDWYERYSQRLSNYRLRKQEEEQIALAETIGSDGLHLLQQIYSGDAPAFLRKIPAVDTIRKVWLQNYYHENPSLAKGRGPLLQPADDCLTIRRRSPFQYQKGNELVWV